MKYSEKPAGILLAVTAALLLMSCGASHNVRDESIDKDPNFGYDQLKGSGLLVAGVASQRAAFTREERVKVGNMISNMLIEKMQGAHDIHIVSTGRLVSSMGLDGYSDFIAGCDREGMFTREDIRILESSVPDIQYILLSYIVNENVIDRSDREYIYDKDKTTVETTYDKFFFLSVDFQIYDVRREKMVWSNVIYNEAERSETRTSETGCMESCTSSVINTILFGSPAEISREEVLDEIVEHCVENLKAARR